LRLGAPSRKTKKGRSCNLAAPLKQSKGVQEQQTQR
jgi:hypothetical protein